MPLIVADGTNSDVANSYVSLSFADEYHAVRDNSKWGAVGGKAKREAALIKATDYIEAVYGPAFVGYPMTEIGLSWPRLSIPKYSAPNLIPDILKRAVCELALQEVTLGIYKPLSREQALKRKKTDVLEKEYFEPTTSAVISRLAVSLLSGLIKGPYGGMNRPVVRV